MTKIIITDAHSDPVKILINGALKAEIQIGKEFEVSDEVLEVLKSSKAVFDVVGIDVPAEPEDEDDAKDPDESLEGQKTGSGVDLGILDGNTSEIKEAIKDLGEPSLLELLAAETAGNTRVGVSKALNEAIDALKPGEGE